MGTRERKCEKVQEAKVENNAQQQEAHSHEDIYNKLVCIERKIEGSGRTQVAAFAYAVGVAFVILGLSYWPGLLEHLGMGTATFYFINPVAIIVLGFIAIIYARVLQRVKKK